MNQKQLLWIAIFAAATLAVVSMAWVNSVSAQPAGDAGVAGAGGADGGGGIGGGGGGGGGIAGGSGGGAVAAHGEYVYILRQGKLYQYAAYDLTLVKKINLRGTDAAGRRRQQSGNQGGGGFGGQAGGRGGDAGQGGNGGQGGIGGRGGGFAFSGNGSGEGVAAFRDYVYVFLGATLHKLTADGLEPVKIVELDSDSKTKDR